MGHRPTEAAVDAWIALMRAQQTALLKIERAFRDANLPSHAWYDVLWELERAGEAGLRPLEIERQILIAQSNISRLIDRLEEKGYVERRPCEDDGRGQRVVITSAGRDMRKRMWPVYGKAITDAVGKHLSEREALSIAALLTKLTDRGR
ncbi:DNA-binding MarR family transcriptional regulator [Pseudorhodoplanes sinuspersici]|uniref:MarR family transcriptional regulator n=2 Tax=Pseudorhodoplanes sinuspersici TaxID=1235591 RepID=A0A1W6ZY35_9HYPH|nr:MarR family transcriptional regulator [Pseudorhodoplanes sinuspersici]RKE74047.1 DNA-binding MarR family transcriptional regulator [Pseudorhodoplanes sinuspersici]